MCRHVVRARISFNDFVRARSLLEIPHRNAARGFHEPGDAEAAILRMGASLCGQWWPEKDEHQRWVAVACPRPSAMH